MRTNKHICWIWSKMCMLLKYLFWDNFISSNKINIQHILSAFIAQWPISCTQYKAYQSVFVRYRDYKRSIVMSRSSGIDKNVFSYLQIYGMLSAIIQDLVYSQSNVLQIDAICVWNWTFFSYHVWNEGYVYLSFNWQVLTRYCDRFASKIKGVSVCWTGKIHNQWFASMFVLIRYKVYREGQCVCTHAHTSEFATIKCLTADVMFCT